MLFFFSSVDYRLSAFLHLFSFCCNVSCLLRTTCSLLLQLAVVLFLPPTNMDLVLSNEHNLVSSTLLPSPNYCHSVLSSTYVSFSGAHNIKQKLDPWVFYPTLKINHTFNCLQSQLATIVEISE